MSSVQANPNAQATPNAQANPSMAVTTQIDYWSLSPRIRNIEWSKGQNAHLAHLHDEQTGLTGTMKVCIDCASMHIYIGCDGVITSHGFENCDTNKPVYHPSYIETHYDLEPNNKYVQHAILRTHRRRLVPTGPHHILNFRGYDPPTKVHRRHVPKCFRGSSPEYIIQGAGGLGTSIYYRRCDGKFRNLAHKVLGMGDAQVTTDQQTEGDSENNSEGELSTSAAVAQDAVDTSEDTSAGVEVPGSMKRKWEA